MKTSDNNEGTIEIIGGVTRSFLSRIPIIKEAIAGAEAYKQYVFKKNVESLTGYLVEKVNDIEQFSQHESFRTPEGEQFIRKIIDAAIDEQLQDKQEFFINAMINGVNDQTIDQLEKHKLIDILRQLSRAAILVLLEIHNIFANPREDRRIASTLINPDKIAESLSSKYHPYLTISAITELVSVGLFSSTTEWFKTNDGSYKSGRYTPSGVNYTEFTDRFIAFISEPSKKLVA
ncbi:MAG: hypothetical protein ACLP7A_08685 [Desulfobaccales bacterium]